MKAGGSRSATVPGSIKGLRIVDQAAESGGIEPILFPYRNFFPSDERRFRGDGYCMAPHGKTIGVGQHLFVAPAGHSGEKVDLALLGLLDDPGRALLIVKILNSEFARKALTIAGEGSKQQADVRRIAVEQQANVFRETHLTLQGHGNPADDDELDPGFSEQHQQFFERGFHRQGVESICRPSA